MPSKVLSMLEIACPIYCENSKCSRCNTVFNTVFIPVDEEESFFEAFGSGIEDVLDFCECKEFGTLSGPIPFFFYSAYEKNNNHTIAMRMDLDFIESLTRVLKNHQEDRSNRERVFLANDAACDCFDSFRVFAHGESGNFNGEFDFNNIPFIERNKVVIVSGRGVRLSVDISTRGNNEQDLCVVKTAWFSLEDLAVLNSWVVKRCGTECRG